MTNEWIKLTELTLGKPVIIEKVRIISSGIRIQGEFELPPLARLSMENQVFIAAFIKCHGSIKEMEHMFGVSYPTIKSRLNRLTEELGFIQVISKISNEDVLNRLENGEISVNDAVKEIENGNSDVVKD